MTHGRGKKGGRGAGLRGGRGNAGLLKHRWMYLVKNMPDHFGRHGFKRPKSMTKRDKIINVGELEEKFPGKKVINLTDEGFDKLLGGGMISSSLKITVNSASEKAVEKIKKQGGEVILPELEEEIVKEVTSGPKEPVEEKNIEEKTEEKQEKK